MPDLRPWRATIIAVAAALAASCVVAAVAASGWTMPSLDDVIAWLSQFPAIVVLALITVTGETLVLAAVVVAVEGSWSLTEIVIWCFVGTVASDTAWFALARAANNRFLQGRRLSPGQQRTLTWLRHHTGERPYLALLFIKFLYGSRFLMLLYLATRQIPLWRFLVYDAAGTLVWLAVLVPAGWLLAHGLISVAAVARLDIVVIALVIVLLLMRGGSAWFTARARQQSLPS